MADQKIESDASSNLVSEEEKNSTKSCEPAPLPNLEIQKSSPPSTFIEDFTIDPNPNNIVFKRYSEKDHDNDSHNPAESFGEENRYFPELLRKTSGGAQNDPCFLSNSLLKSVKSNINFEALEKYAREENTDFLERDILKEEFLVNSPIHLSPASMAPFPLSRNSSHQKIIPASKMSLYGDRVRVLEEDSQDKMRFTFFSIDTGTIQANSLFEIPPQGTSLTSLLKKGVFWINVLAPNDSEMRILSKIFNIHHLTIEDIAMEESREKCELFKTYYFISFRSYVQDQNSPNFLQPVNMYNVVMKEGILSFHFKDAPHAFNVRQRIKQLKEFIKVTPDWINYAILDDITDSFAPLIHKVEVETDTVDELVLILKQSEQSDMLLRIGHNRKVVMSLLRLLGSKVDVIKGLIKRCEERVLATAGGFGDVTIYLGDVQDHIITMLQILNHCEKVLGRSHSNYLAQISIEITQLSNRTNDAVGKLTIFASILVPMTLVSGIFGMNVKVPGRDEDDLVWFFWINGILLFFGIIGVMGAKRRGLI
ncbi:hypothetical protein G9A89_010700 [Geosiphon pyriformis]|nr:hypothetical protein G9A89_010700 [Geosiphon pyriformis]